MAKAVPLFSGSKGNSYFLGTATQGVLIDAGRSCKQIENALLTNSIDPRIIGAVFITHEHTDHCSAVKVLASRYNFKVYASQGTLEALERANRLDNRFDTPHDAAESCCYSVTLADGKTATIATDMGYMTDDVRNAVAHSNFAVIESNHDVDMLKNGPYPFVLKKRILSKYGHLSNPDCAAELAGLVQSGTLRLMLGHLSEQNNTPSIALNTAVNELSKYGMNRGIDYTLDVAPVETNAKSVIF